MKTTGIYVQTLCVPCHNRCRYCLLSWDGNCQGADYDRSSQYAHRFQQWLRENRPDLSFQFYFGYSMEHPRLPEAVDFLNSIGSAGGQFLQLDGLSFRTPEQTALFLSELKQHGIRAINLTFYGTREYHDRFAGRSGDFDYLMTILSTARALGLEVSTGVPLTRENAGQMEELLSLLSPTAPRLFIPHAEGRGRHLDSIRLRQQDFDRLCPAVQSRLNLRLYRTEAQWLGTETLPIPKKRIVAVSLTEENMDFYESLPFDQTIAHLEALDDAYYRELPPIRELLHRYGNPSGDCFYSFRDLCLHDQRRFLEEHRISVYDVTDERNCFSRRY